MLALILIVSVFGFCQSASIVDSYGKCKLSDSGCWVKYYNGLFKEATVNGLPEFDIPVLDPYELHNVEVMVLGLLNFTMVSGQALGGQSCQFDSFIVNEDDKVVTVEFSCEKVVVDADGLLSKTPALTSLLGNIDIHGEGKFSITVDKLKANMEFSFDTVKLDDGEMHYQVLPDSTTYTYKVGKLTFAGGKVFIGSQDISDMVRNIGNENWEAVVKVMGNSFFDRVLQEFYSLVTKFYSKLPINKIVEQK